MQIRKFLAGLLTSAALATVLTAPVLAQTEPPLPVLPAGHPYAALIESHNFAISKGATAEWRKMEGVALDATNKRLYIAVTAIAKGMADKKGGIQLPENPCGAVYMAQLDDKWDITSLKARHVSSNSKVYLKRNSTREDDSSWLY